MKLLLSNLSGKLRRERWLGKSWLIAPATSIVPGVLEGSHGPLLYPPDEIAANAIDWNGVPVVLRHPTAVVDGREVNVSARQPAVLAERLLGYVFNTALGDGSELKHEVWLDEARLLELDATLPEAQRIVPRLERGEPVEVSTGLYTTDEKAPEGATHNGTRYDYVARNYRPDHLAVLPEGKGACSVKDGCGLLANEDPPLSEDSDMDKKQKIAWLVKNCACWKKPGSDKFLSQLPDDQLDQLVGNTKLVLVVNKSVSQPNKNDAAGAWGKLSVKLRQTARKLDAVRRVTANQEGEGETAGIDIAALAEFLGISTDPASDPVAFINELKAKLEEISARIGVAEAPPSEPKVVASQEMGEGAESVEIECPEGEELVDGECKPKMAANRRTQRRAPSLAQWEATMPPEAKAVWNAAKQVERDKRANLVRQIIANGDYASEEERRADAEDLLREPVANLEKMLRRIGRRRAEQADASLLESVLRPDYTGAAGYGGPTANEIDEVLDLEAVRAEEEAAFVANRRNGRTR